jgi:hypothetical protein
MLHRIASGDLPKEPSNPESVATGVLLNAALVAHATPTAAGRTAPLELTEDVRFSLLLDEVPMPARSATAQRQEPKDTAQR